LTFLRYDSPYSVGAIVEHAGYVFV